MEEFLDKEFEKAVDLKKDLKKQKIMNGIL